MIVTVLLLCGGGGGGVLYNIKQLHKARFGGMLPQENLIKIMSFGGFLFISGSDFVLNNFKK